MVIKLQDIHKSFACGFLLRRKAVLRGLTLELRQGDAYALLGANGAGKSTTLRILLGLSRPDHGHGRILGHGLGSRAARRRLGFLPEAPSFHEQLTAEELLRYCARLLGLQGSSARARIDDLLERVQLTHARDRKLRKLSKGMLQRLGLAQALLGDPEILILDEPMSGLDPPGRKLVRDIIVEQRDAGKTVLFSTHILSDAEVVCTRAGILRAGRLSAELELEGLRERGSESVEVTVSALSEAAIAELAPGAKSLVQGAGRALFLVDPGEPVHAFVQAALRAGGHLESVVPRRASLEDLYLRVTHGPEVQDDSDVVEDQRIEVLQGSR